MDSSEHAWSPIMGDFARVKSTGEVGEVIRFEGDGPGRQFVVQVYSEATGRVSERTYPLSQLERG